MTSGLINSFASIGVWTIFCCLLLRLSLCEYACECRFFAALLFILHLVWFYLHFACNRALWRRNIVVSLRLFIVGKSLISQMKTFQIWFHIWHWAMQHRRRLHAHRTAVSPIQNYKSQRVGNWSQIHFRFRMRLHIGTCLQSVRQSSQHARIRKCCIGLLLYNKCNSLSTWMEHTDTHNPYTCNEQLNLFQQLLKSIEINWQCTERRYALIWLISHEENLSIIKLDVLVFYFHTSDIKWFAKLNLLEPSWEYRKNDHIVLSCHWLLIFPKFLFWMLTINCATTTITINNFSLFYFRKWNWKNIAKERGKRTP